MDRAARQDVIMSQAEQDRSPVLRAARKRTRVEITRQILSAHLQLAGSPWPWRPATPFAFTIAAAIGVALLPAAAARRHRP
jgi:hypothetical protein